jgi:hypothetical protein
MNISATLAKLEPKKAMLMSMKIFFMTIHNGFIAVHGI